MAERFVFFQPVQVGDGDVEHEPQDHEEALKDEAVTSDLPIVACLQAKHMKKRESSLEHCLADILEKVFPGIQRKCKPLPFIFSKSQKAKNKQEVIATIAQLG